MISNLIKVLHPILLVVFFIVLKYNDNQDELIINDLIYVFSIILPITIVFTLIMKFLIKNTTKSILISSFTILVFFVYIPIHNLLYEFQISNIEIGKHIILLPLITTASFIIIYAIIKSKKNFEKFLTISYVVILALIIFNASEIMIYSDLHSYTVNDDLLLDFTVRESEFRDVYYIMLDAYSGTDALQKYLNYDNSEFDNSLESLGFFIPEKSFSNYSPTRMSSPSLLNMDYINIDYDQTDLANSLILEDMISNNLVRKIFEKNGYETISFYNELNLISNPDTSNQLCNNAIGQHQFMSFILIQTPIVIFQNYVDKYNYKEYGANRLCIFNEIPYLDEKYSSPLFVFAHVMLPHHPYIFQSDGTLISDTENFELQNETAYLSQLQFTNSKVLDVVKKLLAKEPQPIIVIQSDHGFRFNHDEITSDDYASIERSFSNFSAYYFPDNTLTNNDQVHTLVNSFRILFNYNFGTDYELLENKIFITKNTLHSEDITNILIP